MNTLHMAVSRATSHGRLMDISTIKRWKCDTVVAVMCYQLLMGACVHELFQPTFWVTWIYFVCVRVCVCVVVSPESADSEVADTEVKSEGTHDEPQAEISDAVESAGKRTS